MGAIFLIAMFAALTTASYFIIKDGNKQLEQLDNDDDDPTITCWDDDLNHTEGGFH